MAGRPAKLQVDIVTNADTKGVDAAESRLGKFGASAGKVGKLLAGGLALGLGAAAAAAFKLAQGAAEDEKGAARLAKTLENTTGATHRQVDAVESWITAQGKALGVADDELRPAMEKLVTATGDVAEGQKLASLAMDISAGTGKSLEAVSTALAKAQNGQVAGLARLGVATKDAAGETLSMEDVTKKLATTFEGQAATAANTTAGKFGRLKLQLGEMGETIGSKLLPVAVRIGEWALQMIPKAQKLAAQIGDKLGPAMAVLGQFITEKVVPAAREFATWFIEKIAPGIARAVTPVIEKAKKAFENIRDAIERNREPLTKLGTALGKVAEFLIGKVLPVVGKVITLGWEPMSVAIGFLLDQLGSIINAFDDTIGKAKELWSWFQKIDVPDFKLPGFAGGAVGNLTTGARELAGGSPSWDSSRVTTAAAAMLGDSWSSFATASRSGAYAGPATVDARTFLTVTVDGSGIVDEHRVAAQLAPVLERFAVRMGRPVTAGGAL